jgi:hypothetical protein
LKSQLDEYSRNARLKPAFLVWIPLTFVSVFLSSAVSAKLGVLIGSLTSLGLPFLLAQVGRDYGKRKEPILYSSWGGKPSVALLRHRDTSLNEHTKRRYHANAAALIPSVVFPTVQNERDDPTAADGKYEALSDFLIHKTRDHSAFPLLFQENISYGFRRNLWGMKPLGLSLSLGTAALFSLLAGFDISQGRGLPMLLVTILVLNVILVCFWVFVVNADWVRTAGYAYAERLLECSESIPK